jgi:serine protease AprX
VAWSVRASPKRVTRPENVSPGVWDATADGAEADFFLLLAEQADLSDAASQPNREARLGYVYDRLREMALRSQAPLRKELVASGSHYRAFYIVNMLLVTGDRVLVERMAARPDVARIASNPRVRQALPPAEEPAAVPSAASTIEWGLQHINADDVWAQGYTGTNIVVAGQDTGYDWDHPALIRQYRGYNGVTATHDYNWHDAIHSGGGSCGADSPEPCDDQSHGTHTMGTIVGDDGAGRKIGVAPGARWMGCRNMDQGYGTPETYAECFEFFLAPYVVGGDPLADGVPDLAPHVINNSWTCPESEGCHGDEREVLRQIVENVRAAGIVVVASAGNDGPGCSTVQDPAAIYDAAFSIGATGSSGDIASFSSRGPVTRDGSGIPKPDVSAPGVGVTSCVPGTGYSSKSGTSMAGPHVAGAIALLWSAAPNLIGNVDATEMVIARTARPHTTTLTCGTDQPGDVPNNVYGWGIIDALAAVKAATARVVVTKTASFPAGVPAQLLNYALQVTNTSGIMLTQVTLTDTIPSGTTFAWASGDHVHAGGVVSWTVPVLPPGTRLSASLGVTVGHLPRGTVLHNEAYGLRAAELLSPVMGAPVRSVIPWRVAVPVVLRAWSP